jgi:biopolymer transport protein ExbB/TolQ
LNSIESALYEISKFFLTPVLIVLCLMFIYALVTFGAFLFDLARGTLTSRRGLPLTRFKQRNPNANAEAIELQLLKILEPLRIISRVAPMLGLVATMIPMGPALIAVSSGNAKGMAENLVVAFAAVVVALLSAALTYVVLSVRRRWLLAELNTLINPAAMPSATEMTHG